MAKLTEDVQVFIVQRLASYKTPTEVAELVKEEFGLELDRQQVQHYDPTVGKKPAKKWVDLFETTRDAIRHGTADLALAHKLFRLAELEEMYRKARKAKNYKLAAELLEQAAKEMGEAYSNKRVLQGDSERPLEIRGVNFAPPTAETN
jgi:hypothetical protein